MLFLPTIKVVAISIAIANDQIMKRKGIGIAADINHSIAEIRKPCAYPLANLLAEVSCDLHAMYVNSNEVAGNLPSSEETPIDDGINRQSQT